MTTRTEVADRTLTVYLPESLVAATRGQMVEFLSADLVNGGLGRVRLDASLLITLDASGIGALVHAARITREYTGRRPILVHCADAMIDALTATAVLPLLFEIEQAESEDA
jgi:anti-anti-sigma regulatory factor